MFSRNLAPTLLLASAVAGCAGAPECGDRCLAERRYGAACDGGDAQACFDLARSTIVGGNTFAEPDAAARHERACELGLFEACGWAGMYFRDGPGFDDPEPERAYRNYSRGCEAGETDDCYNAAMLHLEGPEALRDDAEAARLLELALTNESYPAHWQLAKLHRNGRGVERDPLRARELLQSGCERGEGAACVDLGFYQWIGYGGPVDREAAEQAFFLGCEHGEKSFCDLARLFSKPPAGPGQGAILGQLARDPDQGIAVFHASETLPPVGIQGKLYSAVGGESLSAWAAVAAGEITSSEPGEIRMIDTSDYRLKINFCEGCFVALVWTDNRDGAPCPAEHGRVKVTEEKLVLAEPIYFRAGKTAFRAESLSLLDEIAEVLRLCPAIAVEVQVHTDPRGSSDRNYWLSHDRARVIARALAERGIAESRLRYQGFGESCPIHAEHPDHAERMRLLRRTEIWRTDQKAPGSCTPPEPPPMPADYEKQRELN